MFPVSGRFIKAVNSNSRRYAWSGTITTKANKTYGFTADDIVKGSGYITRQICGGTEIELGTVYAAEFGVSIYSDIDRYTLEDAEIKVYFSLTLDGGTVETIPMGVFEVSEANRNMKTLEIKAYDHMLRFERTLKLESSSGTPYQFLKAACDACRVEMAQTVSEINALPNGTATLGIYSDNDIETYRDLIYYTAQVVGCFCRIDRYGRLELVKYENTGNWTVSQKMRYQSSYSDFVTRYTAVSSTNLITQTSEYIAMEKDDALTMNLSVNPLMQFGLKSTRERMLREILTILQKVNYVPFDSSTIGNPAMDPGDILKFTGGHADETKLSCITNIEYRINGKMQIKCVGKNPKLSGAKSKNDKNITGLLNSIESGRVVIYNFVNVSPFTIGQSLTKVMDIDFTATEETSASFQCEMLLEVVKPEKTAEEDVPDLASNDGENPELTIVYKVNDETIDNFMPTKTCLYGKHIVTLFYPVSKVIEKSSNTFSMYLKISDGTVEIGEAQIRATISGQGLAAGLGDWNGRISINENIGFVEIGSGPFLADAFRDSFSFRFPQRNPFAVTQDIGNIVFAGMDFEVDSFSDRKWVTEILRTFVLTAVRGNPKYNDYVAINNDGQFLLQKRHTLSSGPQSCDLGFVEKLTLDTSFLERTENAKVSGHAPGFRLQRVVDTTDKTVAVPEAVITANGLFELEATTQEEQHSGAAEIDEGHLEELSVDVSAFDGVKGVEISI